MNDPDKVVYTGPAIGCWPIVILILGVFFIVFRYTPWIVYGLVGCIAAIIVILFLGALWEARR